MSAMVAVSPRLTFDDASDTAPPSATAKRPCDCSVRVASSCSEPLALSTAPASMRIVPVVLSIALPRSTLASAPPDRRTSAPPASVLIGVGVVPALPLPVNTLPPRTSMLPVAESSNSAADRAPAALLATTMSLAFVVMRTPSLSTLRCPPSSRLPPSADNAPPSSCR